MQPTTPRAAFCCRSETGSSWSRSFSPAAESDSFRALAGHSRLGGAGAGILVRSSAAEVGMAAGFVFGLAMDVVDASVMGQHALAYVLLAFAAAGLSRRVLWFPLSQQALHVLPLFLASTGDEWSRAWYGAEFPGVLWFLSSFTAALLWHPVTYLLLMPQFRPEDKDVHRPI